ncbi:hypothetical protein H920_16714 [Fukomys damarensis]|uniref:Uncharacterized protein n=1 Tax=Fukomys damarensis TaxID=885580 RepID=A0A091CVS8_FUKDA|nr:hypothetical protein H920_16714 [Fukomys damarensis]
MLALSSHSIRSRQHYAQLQPNSGTKSPVERNGKNVHCPSRAAWSGMHNSPVHAFAEGGFAQGEINPEQQANTFY